MVISNYQLKEIILMILQGVKLKEIHTNELQYKIFIIIYLFQRPNEVVAIKAIAKKNLAKSQNLLGKEIKILKVSTFVVNNCMFY